MHVKPAGGQGEHGMECGGEATDTTEGEMSQGEGGREKRKIRRQGL